LFHLTLAPLDRPTYVVERRAILGCDLESPQKGTLI
jgi:hypothetical protein